VTGDGGEERLSVVVGGVVEDLGGGAEFDEAASVHDGDASGELGDDEFGAEEQSAGDGGT